MATFTTPGVYVQEIPTLPSSIVASPTAVPVFIGYTKTAFVNGEQWDFGTDGPTNPIRITSILDYQTIFGGAYNETFDVTLTGPDVTITPSLTADDDQDYRLFYHMQMYFANGGGACYIIAVGATGGDLIDPVKLQAAIEQAEKVDEITLVVIPEAMSASIIDADRKAIYDAMLAHCEKLKDRFSIFDVETRGTSIADDADKFRSFNVSSNNLSYGAAYYPPFAATLSFSYEDIGVSIVADDPNLPANVQIFDGDSLALINTGAIAGGGSVTVVTITFSTGDTLTIGSLPPIDLTLFAGEPDEEAAAEAIADYINATSPYNSAVIATYVATEDKFSLTAINPGTAGNYDIVSNTADLGSIVDLTGGINPDGALYTRINAALSAYPITLYPSATMAGVYASVDNERGVWKAPANVGVALVSSLNVTVKDADQGGLNVDPIGGKSIDVIRQFTGRGILVWGARTLDGNSNEWRYVSVRRLFLMVEDACKHATEFVVFEPNDANTWVRVKGMIENFLTSLWRDGALMGDKPEKAFFVRIGLGQTMTAQDILEGRLIVQIGMAAVRPAEFIVLNFEHKLQEGSI